jgi:type 1 glutamine amidotransferase
MLTVLPLVATLSLAGPAPAPLPARISAVYPPPEDRRRPDRTIAGADAGPIGVLAYSPDGRLVAIAAGKSVKVWNARTGEEGTGELARTLEGLTGKIVALGWSVDGHDLVAVAENQAVEAWDTTTGNVLRSASLKAPLRGVAFRPGAEPHVAGWSGKQLRLVNHQTGEVVKSYEPADARLRAVAFSPDGKLLAAGNDKGVIRLWNVDSGALVRTIEGGAAVAALTLGATHAAAAAPDGRVKLWKLEGEGEGVALEPHKGAVHALAFSTKGEQLAAAGADRVVRVWDVATAKLLCLQEGHTAPVLTVAWSSNGQKMASAGADKSLRYWTVPLPPIAPAELEKIAAAVPAKATAAPKKPRRLLVLWRADAILHKGGVVAANAAIELMGAKTGAFEADFTRDIEALDAKVLAKYDAIVLNSTAHLLIPDEAKRQALLDYVKGGGGVIGIHAAIDMFRHWPEGAQIVGATFGGHPWHPTGTWSVKLDEPAHPLLRAWAGKGFKMHDEFYELAEPYARTDRRVLMSLDTSDPATLAVTPLHRTDKDFAVSWIKRYGEGRVFYCMFGHLGEPFQIPAVLQYYLDGIQFAVGDLDADTTPAAGVVKAGVKAAPAPAPAK